MKMKIAKTNAFAGKPTLHIPSLLGGCTGKEIRYRVPVTGVRPIKVQVMGLPEGLCWENGQIFGTVTKDCVVKLHVTAQNAEGITERDVTLQIGEDHLLLTPLMGFTSWNAFRADVTQEDMLKTAEQMKERGLLDFGYNYINIDSGWQGEYGGKFDAVMPNEKFPDMKGMCEQLHEMGFLCGIYSTPYRFAWGCPDAPGCTVGEPNPYFISFAKNPKKSIGKVRKEWNNVQQWSEWGFDYLKYDWNLNDPINTEFMKRALRKADRAFGYCVTVDCSPHYAKFWAENCNSWRNNADSADVWDGIKKLAETLDPIWKEYVRPGHFYDLDMLELSGMAENNGVSRLSLEEEVTSYTLRAFFSSPIQLSCRIDTITEEEMNIFCNDEILAIHHDSLADFPDLLCEWKQDEVKGYQRKLENGDWAVAIFNFSDQDQEKRLEFPEEYSIRDVWAKETVATTSQLNCFVERHGVRVFRLSK